MNTVELELDLKFKVENESIFSIDYFLNTYLYGIDLCDKNGKRLDLSFIQQNLLIVQQIVENNFYLKLKKQIISESNDFIQNDYRSWGYIQTSFQVAEPLMLEGFINRSPQLRFDYQWLSVFKQQTTSERDDQIAHRQIHLVPSNDASTYTFATYISANLPMQLSLTRTNIPNYWRITYITGYDVVPLDLVDFVAKLLAIIVLCKLNDIIYGAGQNSINVSLDGISQSNSYIRNSEATIYNPQIKQYLADIDKQLPLLKGKYRGLIFGVI